MQTTSKVKSSVHISYHRTTQNFTGMVTASQYRRGRDSSQADALAPASSPGRPTAPTHARPHHVTIAAGRRRSFDQSPARAAPRSRSGRSGSQRPVPSTGCHQATDHVWRVGADATCSFSRSKAVSLPKRKEGIQMSTKRAYYFG